MHLTFYARNLGFAENLHALRQAIIRKQAHAPKFLNVIIAGRAHSAKSAHIRQDGWFAYSDDVGEHRIPLDQVSYVKAYY